MAHESVRTDPPAHFDVTAVIGTVVMSDIGDESPMMAAFRIIAEHDAPGLYSFPVDGYDGNVTVGIPTPPSKSAFDTEVERLVEETYGPSAVSKTRR